MLAWCRQRKEYRPMLWGLISSGIKAVTSLFSKNKPPSSRTTLKKLPAYKFPRLASPTPKSAIAPYWNNGRLTARQIAANARASRIAQAAARKAEAVRRYNAMMAKKRKAANTKFKGVLKQNRTALSNNLARFKRAGFGAKPKKMTWQERVRQEYADKALKINDSNLKNSDFWDMFSGNLGAQSRAREFAQKQQASLQKGIKLYEARAREALSLKAKKEQRIKWLSVHGTQQQFNRELSEAKKWLARTQRDLQYQQASIEGLAQGWGKSADRPSTGWLSDVGRFLDPKKNPVTAAMGKVWKYTLGSGDKNVPSIVSAPSRAVTALTNLGKKKGDILYDKEGKPFRSSGNAWQDTWRQANLNAHTKPQSFDDYVKQRYMQQKTVAAEMEALKQKKRGNLFGSNPQTFKAFNQKQPFANPKKLFNQKEYEEYRRRFGKSLKKQWREDTSRSRSANALAAELALDPLMYAGGTGLLGKGGKVTSFAGKSSDAVKAWAKTAGKTKFGSKVVNSKLGKGVKWLGKEYVPPKRAFVEAVEEYKKVQKPIQDAFFKKYRRITEKIKDNKFDYTVLDDIGRLSDDEAAILQRMTGINKFALRDRVRLRGMTQATKKQLLLDIHRRAQSNARVMKSADKVESNRFVDRYYSNSWAATPKDKNKYNFRSFRKSNNILGADDLRRAQIERYMMSSVDDVGSGAGSEAVSAAQKELRSLLAEYDEAKKLGQPAVEKALRKVNGRGRHLRKALGIPMSVWKSSVLALRPAWYVNNSAYNAFAGLNAGGAGYVKESLKMLKRGSLKQARRDNPRVVGNLDRYFETKGNPLWKPASAIEDANRLAAFKALKSKGWSDDKALKEVNKFFFDYSTKNWERPLKTVMPFWSWTKSTGKLAARLPFERPVAAKGLHMNDENNQRQIERLPPKMRKYFEGRQYVGEDKEGNPRFMNTPFNPFSAGNFSNVSANPFIAALSEIAKQEDYYGNKLKDKTILGVFADKFPQAKLAKQAYQAWKMSKGDMKSAVKYFGEISSDGFAYTKERQGFDKNKSNYNSKLDPSSGLEDNIKAFLGIPKTSTFNRGKFEKTEKLTKLNEKFFDIDWEKKYPDYNKRVAAQKKLAKSYGFDLEKDLYKGLWAKNDTEFTAGAKKQKEEARQYLSKFWKEYHSQPYGSKSIWVRDKMKSVVASGVIAKNPFIADGLPDWYDPKARGKADTAEFWRTYFASDKATRRKLMADNPKYNKFNYSRGTSQKKIDYLAARSSGDWTLFNQRYGFSSNYQPSTKKRLYDEAKRTGDWSKFYDYVGDTPKYKAQQAASKFWKKYFASDEDTKKALLKANPKYDRFKDDEPKTQAEWDKIMLKVKADRKSRAMKNTKYRGFYEARLAEAKLDKATAARRFVRRPALKFK